jgi:5-methylcytosine-specific restriction endonuclease McrA
MENLLGQFYGLCENDWCLAVILHNLYQKALTKTNGLDNYTSTCSIQKLAKEYSYRIGEVSQAFYALEEFDLLEFTSIKSENYIIASYPLSSSLYPKVYKEKWVQFHRYTLYMGKIARRLPFHSQAFYAQERDRIKSHNRRASDLNHPGALTFEQWMITLSDFDYSCAYCGGKYDVLEHFIPLTFDNSGTTRTNCVPACNRCNSLKGPYHPERMPGKIRQQFGNRFEYIQDWLKQHDYPDARYSLYERDLMKLAKMEQARDYRESGASQDEE